MVNATHSSDRPAQKFCGFLTLKQRWSLSWRGWLLLVCAVLLAGYGSLLALYPFLAVTQRVDSNLLVVEGWVHEYAIRAAAEEFKTGSYQRVFSTGGPVVGSGHYINDFNTAASVGADLLRAAGVPSESVQMVPSRVMDRDRTYGSAVALREWFREHNLSVRGMNIVTEDVHARRTRLLFQEAFGRQVDIGVIAIPNPDYDEKHWWRYSEGLKEVVSEGSAYLYARFFFHPSRSD